MGYGNNMQNNLLYHWERKATGWTDESIQLAVLRDTNRSKSMTTNGHNPIKSHSNHVISTEVGCKPGKKSLAVVWMSAWWGKGYGCWSQATAACRSFDLLQQQSKQNPAVFSPLLSWTYPILFLHQHTITAHLPDGLTAAGVAMFPQRRKITKRRRCRWRTIRLESPRERLSPPRD